MSLTTLVTFVEVFNIDINGNKSTKHLLQNGKREPSEESNSAKNTILFNGKNYPLSMAKAQEAVLNRYFVEVNVCIMKNDDINTLENGSKSILTTDTWLAASLSYDPQVVEVLLSSAVDAVGVNVPNIVLTTEAVGKLPVTSDIQNR